MDYTVKAGPRSGRVSIPASKSYAHRMLICAALSGNRTTVICDGLSNDIIATIECLRALGARIETRDGSIVVDPVMSGAGRTETAGRTTADGLGAGRIVLPCNESGSTLRFLLPVAGALGADAIFMMAPGLAARPVGELLDVMRVHGVNVTESVVQAGSDGQAADVAGTGNESSGVSTSSAEGTISISGRLTPGEYEIPGNVSSQYISGLLMALPLLDGDSRLVISGSIESRDYISITEDALRRAGIRFTVSGNVYTIPGRQHYVCPETLSVEQDWSNAAFFLCMGALSPLGITVEEMPTDSVQGDREIMNIIREAGAEVQTYAAGDEAAGEEQKVGACGDEAAGEEQTGRACGDEAAWEEQIDRACGASPARIFVSRGELRGFEIDASKIPDLVPTIAALASLCEGTTRITNAGRLRIKESDRLATTAGMLKALGADVTELADGLVIYGKGRLDGGTVDACNDHRIAMAAAVAACGCERDVVVRGAECIAKSFPSFWERLSMLDM